MTLSRTQAIMNRIELVAKKLGMTIEDAVSILEGKHDTHAITQKYRAVENPTEAAGQSNTTDQKSGTVGAGAAAGSAGANLGSATTPTNPPVKTATPPIPGVED
jgi:hypothetical protein